MSPEDGARLLKKPQFDDIQPSGELPKDCSSPLPVKAKKSSKKGKRKSNKKGKRNETRSQAKAIAIPFYEYIKADPIRLARASDRDQVTALFQDFFPDDNPLLEGFVMLTLRQLKLVRSKRYGKKVIVTFSQGEPGNFPPQDERQDARARVLQHMEVEESNKEGVSVSEANGLPDIVPPKGWTKFHFEISAPDDTVRLEAVTVTGPQRRAFAVENSALPLHFPNEHNVQIVFTSTGTGVYRALFRMSFTKDDSSFGIVRRVAIKSGDKALDDILKPTSPYKKKERRVDEPPTEIVPGPRMKSKSPSQLLPHHRIPSDTRELIKVGELEHTLKKPDTDVKLYAKFWKDILWASEHQAYDDIKLYDMENASLKREGHFMVLHVAGLAEGRPSVLRGDTVNVTWNNRMYEGSVKTTRLLEILIEFDRSFHQTFNHALDKVNVRFTFSRTTFRTSHEACSKAPKSMGEYMLTPKREHWIIPYPRIVPNNLQWANPTLNVEQRAAVMRIVKGGRRPLPYVLFGPPGTGKTTTMIEVVYQLFRHKDSLNLLLVAPSNDAADLLVEKLAPYFPPSEMKRIVAYSRSIDQVSPNVRPYVKDGLTDKEMSAEIMTGRIIVSTVNLAARFFYYFGIPQGHFDVLCVDEAGHATEPEVVGVAASLMDFKRQDSRVGQLILAGDPRQLGPVVTSDLCERFGLDISYMERLTKAEVYSRGENGEYPEDLLTKLIRNYRSHPTILKLPNQMFYDNELLVCGDVLSTFSLARWEHLPQTGFPVIFHAVNGENLREGTSPSWFNPQEAEEVVNYVDLLINQSRPAMMPKDIGIITPYARQAQKIRLALKHRNFHDIKVGSVETFQGQERRCIIISTVRAETELLDHDLAFNLGFVANEKRFNVAVTRAKSLLVVIGNPRVLATDEKNWLPFLKFCKENNAWMGEPWNETEVGTLGLLSYGKTELSLDSILAETDDWLLLNGISDGEEKEERGFMNREE